MDRLKEEFNKIHEALQDGRYNNQYSQLYAAQQALGWAIDQEMFKSPLAMIVEDLERHTNICTNNKESTKNMEFVMIEQTWLQELPTRHGD